MLAPINPQHEQIRAQRVVDSLTDYNQAVDVLAPAHTQRPAAEPADDANRHVGQTVARVFNAIKRNGRAKADAPAREPARSTQQVTTSGC